jgi:hypothetical protein
MDTHPAHRSFLGNPAGNPAGNAAAAALLRGDASNEATVMINLSF